MAATTAPTFEPTTTALTDPDTVLGLDYAEPGAMYPNWKGLNYDADMPVADIVAVVRRELRKAIKAGTLGTATKVSVRKRLSTHKWAIDVTLTVPKIKVDADTPGAVEVPDHWGDMKWVVATADGYAPTPDVWKNTVEPGAWEAKAKAEAFIATFNHDRSDSMTDYYEVKFYSSVLIKEG